MNAPEAQSWKEIPHYYPVVRVTKTRGGNQEDRDLCTSMRTSQRTELTNQEHRADSIRGDPTMARNHEGSQGSSRDCTSWRDGKADSGIHRRGCQVNTRTANTSTFGDIKFLNPSEDKKRTVCTYIGCTGHSQNDHRVTGENEFITESDSRGNRSDSAFSGNRMQRSTSELCTLTRFADHNGPSSSESSTRAWDVCDRLVDVRGSLDGSPAEIQPRTDTNSSHTSLQHQGSARDLDDAASDPVPQRKIERHP